MRETEVTPAQVHSAGLLTGMLRSRWALPDGNCVTHEMVSVNPDRMLIGYHTDWAGRFPYEALGLDNPYRHPLPAVTTFGFAYDAAFVAALGGGVWPGLELATQEVMRQAAHRGLPAERYRRQLQQDFRRRRLLH